MNDDYKSEKPAELKRRLTEAEGVLEGLRNGRITSIPGAENLRVVTAIEQDVHADLQRAQALAQFGTWRFVLKSGRVIASLEARKIYGVDSSPLTIKQVQLIPLKRFRPYLDQAMRLLISAGVPYDVEFMIRRPADNAIRHIHSIAEYDPQRKIIFGTLQDITYRKEVEEQLRQEYQRLAFVIEGSRLGTWEWDILDNTTIFNETWAQLLGYTLAELSPFTSETRGKLVHPEDLGRVLRAIADCLLGKTPYYECEFRMRHKEGHWLWILDRGMVMTRDESGQPLWMFGTHADVTARKNAEEVTRARQRYLDTILETMVDGFWILDGNGHFLECNQAYCRLSGYSRDEILSMHLRDVEALESDVDIARHCERIIHRGADLFKTMHRRKDGSVFPVEVSVTWLSGWRQRAGGQGRNV